MADGRGGRRIGAGRPKGSISEKTRLKRLALAEAQEHAEKALAGLVNMMDEKLSNELRRAVYNDIMDRVWGKPTQYNQNENSGEAKIVIEYVNDWRQAH